MRNFLLRIVVYALAVALTASLLPGIDVVNNDLGTLLIIGIVFGLVNAFLRPILTLLTCPFIILTLGLFVLVVNGLLLAITASLSGGRLIVDGFWAALFGGIVMSIVVLILEGLFGLREEDKRNRQSRRD
jgi:putative membrane protein